MPSFVPLLLIVPALGGLFSPCTTPGCVNYALDLSEDELLKVSQGTPETWVVVFYANWCPHCQHYSPTFKRIAGNFAGLENTIKFGGYDCAAFSGCSDYDIKSYPVIKTFSKHAGSSPRTADDEEFRGTKVAARSDEALSAHIRTHLLGGAGPGPANVSTGVEDALKKKTSAPAVSEVNMDWDESLLSATRKDHYWDSYIAVFESMKNSLFLKATSAGLSDEVWQLAKNYVRFAAQHFPNGALQDSLRSFSAFLSERKPTSEAEWRADLMSRFPGVMRESYKSCKTYTCAQWSLFHLLAQAVEEEVFPRQEFYNFVSIFADNFFGCTDCRDHFKAMLNRDEKERVDMPVNLWFWKAHNEATARIYFGNRVAWPPAKICSGCWKADGKPNMEEIKRFLHHGYREDQTLDFADHDDAFGDLTFFYIPITASITMVIIIVMYLTCSSLRSRTKLVNTVLRCLRSGQIRRNSALSPRVKTSDVCSIAIPSHSNWLESDPLESEGHCSPRQRLAKLLHIFSIGDDTEVSQSYRSSVLQRRPSDNV